MTSKSLFFKLLKKDIKERIWCPILIAITFFLTLIVECIMRIQILQMEGNDYLGSVSFYYNNELLNPADNGITTFAVIVFAILCGLSSFYYLNSKKKIDLYHSLPVSRNVIFASKYVSGVICFVVPFLFNIIVVCMIGILKEAFTFESIGRVIGFACFETVFFISIYSSVILGVMLTANLVLNAIGSMVLLSYGIIVQVAIILMKNMFYKTYVLHDVMDSWICLSPVQHLLTCLKDISDTVSYINPISYKSVVWDIVIEVVVAIVLTAICLVLFRIRPSESAGKSMVFPISEMIVRTLFSLPTAILIGMFFSEMSYHNSFIWFSFGTVFGYLIVALVMEMIYRLDFKQAFCHVRQLIVNFVILAIVIAVFKFDITGYDKYLPNENKIDRIAMSVDGLDSDMTFEDEYNTTESRLNRMSLPADSCAIDLARYAIAHPLSYDLTEDNEEKSYNGDVMVTYCFYMKSGAKVYRQYTVDYFDQQVNDLMDEVYKSKEYKDGVFPILTDDATEYFRLSAYNEMESTEYKLSDDEWKEFLKIYREDLYKLSLKDMAKNVPIGKLYITKKRTMYEKRAYEEYFGDYPVYPQFTRTIEWLAGKDFTFDKKIDMFSAIDTIQIYDYLQEYESPDSYYTDYAHIEIKDPKEIEEIMKYLVPIFISENNCFYPIDNDSYSVDVVFKGNFAGYAMTYAFQKENIPDYIIQRLAEYEPKFEME